MACDQVRARAFHADGREHRHRLAAAQFGSRVSSRQSRQLRAAWVEPASGRDRGGIGRLTGQHASGAVTAAWEHRDEGLGVGVARLKQDLVHRPDLDDPAQVHDSHPVGDIPRHTKVVADDESGHG